MTPDPDELNDITSWAGPPRGVHHPEDDWHEENATPPDGPAGVSEPLNKATPTEPDAQT
jgi:hypothetical protein